MTGRHAANVVVTTSAIPLVLWLDRDSSLGGQLLLGVATFAMLHFMLRALPAEEVARVWGCVAVGALLETFFTQVWGAYAYRLGNVPTYVFFGHGMICAASKSWAATYPAGPARRGVVLLAALVSIGLGIAGLFSAHPDVEGALFLPLFLPLLGWSPRRLEHAHTFFFALMVEWLGTALGTWQWAPVLPWLHVSAGNPPSVAAGGYCWFAVLGGLLVTAAGRTAWRSRSGTAS